MQVIVKLTTGCNLKCVYCSEGNIDKEDLSIETLYKLIDELPILLNKYKDNNIDLLWHGGESLIVGKKYLSEVMQYAQNKLKEYNLHFLMQTNGTLIDDEWIELFEKFNVGLGISLDGYKDLHDKNRLTKNGQPTFNTILNNIIKLKNKGISVGTLMVLNTKEKIDVDKLFRLIKQYDLHPNIHPVIPCGRAKTEDKKEIDMIYNNYINLMSSLYEKIMEDDEIIIIEPLNEIMDAILGITSIRECSFNGSCGNKFICLYANGDVGFCGRAITLDNDNLIYGNLKNDDLIDLYESANADKIRQRQKYLKNNDCKNCLEWDLCHGGCSFEAVNFSGNLYSKYPHCELRKKLIYFFRTKGLELLKQHLLKQKRQCRIQIKCKQELLEEIKDERK